MNIINLRSVADFEISDSFEGILRISPNVWPIENGEIIDDPEALLVTKNQEIKLSDSAGYELPLTFVPKYSVVTVAKDKNINISKNLIHISHLYKKLYISDNLHIKSTLYIDKASATDEKRYQSPLLFIKDNNVLAFPIDSPDYRNYVNYNKKIELNPDEKWEDAIFKRLGPNSSYYTTDHPEQVKIDGKPIYRYATDTNGLSYKVPELNRRSYALGVCPGHTYDIAALNKHNINHVQSNVPSGKYTQLSYVSLEDIIWKNVEASNTGIIRNNEGRYFDLNPISGVSGTENDLATELFGVVNDALKAEISAKAPITGLGVQSLTMHYNAIPAKRYFFQLERRRKALGKDSTHFKYNNTAKYYEKVTTTPITPANLSIKGVMNNITSEYALCDGKTLYNGDTQTSDYPIDTVAFKLNLSGLHNKLLETNNKITTPPLFEIDQYTLRYLRGLNWLREGYDSRKDVIAANNSHTFINNELKYKYPGAGNDDLANHAKDINEVAIYYANYDNISSRRWKHAHFLFAKFNGEVGSNADTNLESEELRNILTESVSGEEYSNSWNSYSISFNRGDSPKFRYIMKTLGYKNREVPASTLRIMQDCPVSSEGGSNKYFHNVQSCYKFGKRKVGVCMNHRVRCGDWMHIRNGKYSLASANGGQWRFITSLPIQNKYGPKGAVITETKFSTTNYIVDKFKTSDETPTMVEGQYKIDDSLPSPPSINFIPLIKI